jgi:demethylmenaquinone methyltransferase/2-methoxy-6-polyprenyl-1,4-benzoquinol methylase
MMAAGGVLVEGFDISRSMLDVAQRNVISANMEQYITLMRVGEMETTFRDESYDRIVSNLVFSELSTGEQIYVLQESRRLLKNQGLLIIGDEIVPLSSVNRRIYRLIRFPLAVLTFLLTQSITRSVKELEKKIISAGFQIVSAEKSLLGSFELIVAKKGEKDELY